MLHHIYKYERGNKRIYNKIKKNNFDLNFRAAVVMYIQFCSFSNLKIVLLQFSEWTDHDKDIPDIGK